MDKTRNHIIWLKELYDLGVISKSTYSYELIKIGKCENWIDDAINYDYNKSFES